MFKGWKTITFNLLALAVLAAQQVGYTGELDPAIQNLTPIIVVLVNLVLRYFTTTPVLKKEKPLI